VVLGGGGVFQGGVSMDPRFSAWTMRDCGERVKEVCAFVMEHAAGRRGGGSMGLNTCFCVAKSCYVCQAVCVVLLVLQDGEIRKLFQRSLQKQGMKFKLNTKVRGQQWRMRQKSHNDGYLGQLRQRSKGLGLPVVEAQHRLLGLLSVTIFQSLGYTSPAPLPHSPPPPKTHTTTTTR
jgi:hypothetical protein